MRLALALICKGSDEEAQLLWENLRRHKDYVDGIFVTSTYKPGETPNALVDKVCDEFGAIVSHFEWCNDFSKARNYNFAQVPKDYDYILWLDADDGLRGIETLKETIEAHPVDAYSLYYMYAFDDTKKPIVVHQKTQVVKNDGCVEWAGALHEDFQATREITTYFLKGIERIHLSNDDRFAQAKERNLEVSKQNIEEAPADPRSWWNIGNSYKALGRDREAIDALTEFLRLSQSDDEKYIVRLRRAESFWALGQRAEAMDEARYAIGTKPTYPDAYHLLGTFYFENKQYPQAAESYVQGLKKKPPYTSIIVYNPRDYDFTPMMNLAKTFWHLSRPDLALPLLRGCRKIYPEDENLKKWTSLIARETTRFNKVMKIIVKLQKITDRETLRVELEKIPKDFQSHPGICSIRNNVFVKTESSGRDIAFVCGFTQEVWTPETAKAKGIGGSEEAIIWLSRLLAEQGWNVTVYNNCGHKAKNFGKVSYKPFWEWNPRDKQDIVVLWRHPKMLDHEINATNIYLDLHDVLPPGELTPTRLAKLAKIFVKSQFHRSLYPNVPDDKFVIVPNGIDSSLFSRQEERDPYLLINTSSPDRSLSALLDCYAQVKAQVPQAKLKWAYGWNVFDVVHGDNLKMVEWKHKMQTKMTELGVEELGRLNHADIAKLYLQAQVFAYPSEFAEIDCISLSKAMAAGAIPVTTDFAAMGEKKHDPGVFIHSTKTKDDWAKSYQFDFAAEQNLHQEWTDSVIHILNAPSLSEADRAQMRTWAQESYDWHRIADVWNTELLDNQNRHTTL